LAADSVARRRLENLVTEVRVGDPKNVEAQAAKIYWQAWLIEPDRETATIDFRRLRDGIAPNGLLNYGYAVLRAAVARAIVAAGLHAGIGLFHSHRANAFCLADDLMEPLRPLVDDAVRELYYSGETEIDRATKEPLLALLSMPVQVANEKGPLMVALHRYVASLVKCLEGSEKLLEVPVPCLSADTVACGLS
jgi:CRISPR-associated protein Cas1